MKKLTSLLIAFMLLSVSCMNEDPSYIGGEGEKPQPTEESGYLTLSDMSMRIVLDDVTDNSDDDTGGETVRPTSSSTPDINSFIVEIIDQNGQKVVSTTYGEIMSEGTLEIAVGSYTLNVISEDITGLPATMWEHPVYGGTQSFSILKAQTTTINEVVCTLKNIKVTLVCSKDLADQLTDDTASSVTLGQNSITFAKGEERAAYFTPIAELNTLEFELNGKFADTSTPVKFSKVISNVKAGEWRKITLVITYSDKGDIKIDLVVDSFIQDEEVVVNATQGIWEPIIELEPPFDPTAPTLEWVDSDLTQPFELLPSHFDEWGVCTYPFVFELSTPNIIKSFELTISSTNSDFMAAMGSIIPQSVDLCALTPSDSEYSILSGFGFPVGERLDGSTLTRFDIGGLIPMLYNNPGYDGVHTFVFSVEDQKALKSISSLNLVVKREGDPAPEIVWADHDITQQYTVVDDMNIDISVAAVSGIKSMIVTIDSEKLTPDELLTVGIPAKFDLAAIEGVGELTAKDVADNLIALGFPVNDDVKNQTYIEFSITKFVPMLMLAAQGKSDFIIEVTDNQGKTTTQTLQLFVE